MAADLSEVRAGIAANNQKLDVLLETVETETTQVAAFREEQRAAIASLQEMVSAGAVDPAEIQNIVAELQATGEKIDASITKIQAIQE